MKGPAGTSLSPDGRTLYVSRGNLPDAVAFELGGFPQRERLGRAPQDVLDSLSPEVG